MGLTPNLGGFWWFLVFPWSSGDVKIIWRNHVPTTCVKNVGLLDEWIQLFLWSNENLGPDIVADWSRFQAKMFHQKRHPNSQQVVYSNFGHQVLRFRHQDTSSQTCQRYNLFYIFLYRESHTIKVLPKLSKFPQSLTDSAGIPLLTLPVVQFSVPCLWPMALHPLPPWRQRCQRNAGEWTTLVRNPLRRWYAFCIPAAICREGGHTGAGDGWYTVHHLQSMWSCDAQKKPKQPRPCATRI